MRNGSKRGESGFTMVETATMLTVMFILAGALVPIVSESIDTARVVKAANDARMIATGMIQFERDLGPAAIAYGTGSYATSTKVAAVDVLTTDGEPPMVDDTSTTDAPDYRKQFILNRPTGLVQSGSAGRRAWLDSALGLVEDHLISNRAGYRLKATNMATGWNGPYISELIKSDPWGHRYQINTRWLDGGTSAADQNGQARHAVFVVSAGGNGVIDTAFEQPISDAVLEGDDLGVRIQ